MIKYTTFGNFYRIYEDERGNYIKDGVRYELVEATLYVDCTNIDERNCFIELENREQAIEYFNLAPYGEKLATNGV